MQIKQLQKALATMTLAALVAAVLFSVPLFGGSLYGEALFVQSSAQAQEEEDEPRPPPETRTAQQLSRRVADRIQELIELRDQDNYPEEEALAMLSELRDMYNDDRLNDYEEYMMWQFYAIVDQDQEDYAGALESYEQILAMGEERITPEQLEQTLLQVGALYTALERFREAVGVLERYNEVAQEPNPDVYFRLAVAYFMLEEYDNAVVPIRTHMELVRQQGQQPELNAYRILQNSLLSMERYEEALPVVREMIVLFDDDQSWIQWAGLQGQLEMVEEQAQTFFVNYTLDHLDRESQLVTTASLMFSRSFPHGAAQVLQQGIDAGIIEETEDNLSFLAQAYQASREYELAVEPMERAAEMSDDGELYVRLGNVHLVLYQFEEAAEAFDNAFAKGGLNRPDQAYLSQARAYMELNMFEEGIEAAQAAGEADERSEDASENWVQVLTNQQRRYEALERQREQYAGFFRQGG